jgi:hypothetical protein
MLRKLNFTERAKIPRSSVRVSLRRDVDGTLVFDPQVSFDGVDVPSSARVFIEAYYRTSFMRFDCGSVEAVRPPDDRRLTDIDGTSIVRFRVKIVDSAASEHRILAVADDIVVAEEREETGGRVPLLPVSFTEALGQQAWRIAFEPSGPVLELNNRIPTAKETARNDAAFFALVYPAVVRQILTKIVLIDEAGDDDDEWPGLWLRWAARFAGPPPAGGDAAAFWIDDVVAAFSDEQRPVERWRAVQGERS